MARFMISMPDEMLKKLDEAARKEHRSRSELLRGPFLEFVTDLSGFRARQTKHLFDLRGCKLRSGAALRTSFFGRNSFQTIPVKIANPFLDVGRMRPKRLTNLGSGSAFSGEQNDASSNALLLAGRLRVVLEPFMLIGIQRSDE